ncbi:LysR substrate-binding domain-containing protein [uncultured Nitratireductor sp.]|uniref:LysR substrate-binding domain-containing protein n=1 Tax=uncultured Nitratireductor sp. TaxID=520953 RepID=UPI0025CBC06B|nr:LysR substrate-binding domain-containing protein [uncultured Nitratireductor sp.]
MNFRQLEAYNAVMISGSTVRAAELMGITQPAVSRLIAELENATRFPLFDRVRGRLVPPPEGQLFFRDVESSFKGLDRLRTSAANIRDYGAGTLKVASLAAGGAVLVPEAIRHFRERHPKVRITFHITWSAAIRNGITDGLYDLGLAADEADRSGVDSQLFGNFPALVAMPPDHPLARHQRITPQLLHRQPLIGLVPEDRARQRFDHVMAEAGAETFYVIETPSAGTVCSLALSGDAVGITNPMVIPAFRDTELIFRPFDPSVMFRAYLLYPANRQKSQLVRDFTGCLFELRNRFKAFTSRE